MAMNPLQSQTYRNGLVELSSLSGLSIRLSCGFQPKYCAAAFVAGRLWWSHWSVELGHAACIWGYLVQPLRGNLKLVYVGSQPMGMPLVVGYRQEQLCTKSGFCESLGIGLQPELDAPPCEEPSPRETSLQPRQNTNTKTIIMIIITILLSTFG